MSKSKLVREVRIYLYADGNHEVRILEARAEPKRDANGRFASKRARPRTIFCPNCGAKIVM